MTQQSVNYSTSPPPPPPPPPLPDTPQRLPPSIDPDAPRHFITPPEPPPPVGTSTDGVQTHGQWPEPGAPPSGLPVALD